MPNTALSWRKINYAPIGRQAEEKLPKKKKWENVAVVARAEAGKCEKCW